MNADFTTLDQRVIIERRTGWEKAEPATLAAIFGTSHQHITAICKQVCASCEAASCSCSDAAWVGEAR